jgi:hypothetical protein
MKRLIKSAVEINPMQVAPPVKQKAPSGYNDFEDFIEHATEEEINNYKGEMDAETVRRMEQERFNDSENW